MSRQRWDEADRDRLQELARTCQNKNGTVNWGAVQQHFPDRSTCQIKSYFFKYMEAQTERRGNHRWTFEEVKTLLEVRYAERYAIVDIQRINFPDLTNTIIKSKLQNLNRSAAKLRLLLRELDETGCIKSAKNQFVELLALLRQLHELLTDSNAKHTKLKK